MVLIASTCDGMNAGHGGEAELARLLGKAEQTRAVVEIDPYAVDGLHVGRGGGDDDGGAGIDQIPCFALAYRGEADLAAEVFRAKNNADDAR